MEPLFSKWGRIVSRYFHDTICKPNLFFLKALFKALGLDDKDFKFGLTKIFFRPGKVKTMTSSFTNFLKSF